MTDRKTLRDAFGVLIDYFEKSTLETEKEAKRHRQLADFYHDMGIKLLADEESMNDEEWSIACQQNALVRGMFHHHNRRDSDLGYWSTKEKIMAVYLEYALESI